MLSLEECEPSASAVDVITAERAHCGTIHHHQPLTTRSTPSEAVILQFPIYQASKNPQQTNPVTQIKPFIMGNLSSCMTEDAIQAQVSIRPPTKPAVRPRRPVTQWFSGAMTNFKTAITKVFDDAFMPYSSSSVVLTEVEEQWFNQLLSEVDAARARYAFTPVTKPEEDEDDEEDAAVFLGPSDTVVEMIGAYQPLSAEWMAKRKLAPQDDDCVSSTTEATDSDSELDSKCEFDFYDDEDDDDDDEEFYDPVNDEFECCHSCHKMQEREYYADTDDTVTKAERLLRLASSIHEGEPVYVDDYLCPCGECPAYKLIESDVEHTVTWRSADERCSIIRVLQAFSTYNEVLGYNIDMIEAAEECLHMWLGDEDQALKSLIMLYDELPQLCASYF